MNEEAQKQFKAIIEQMALVYKHDSRPWMIGYSGGKDSTLLCQLTFEMLESLAPEERKKKVYIVTSDTMVENPVVRRYMHNMSAAINAASIKKQLNIESHIIYPEVKNRFWSLVIGLGYPTPEAPGFRWCTDRLKILPSNAFTYNVIRKDGEIVILLGVRKAESSTRSKSITSREIEGKILTPHDSIPKAYIYSPLSEIENKDVWEYLLKDDGQSAWGTDEDTGSLSDYISTTVSATAVKNPSTNMSEFLQNKIGYNEDGKNYGMCISVLNQCQDYSYDGTGQNAKYNPTNNVIKEFLNRTLVQIKSSQDTILADYAENCISDVSACLAQSNYDVDNNTEGSDGKPVLSAGNKLAIKACNSIITTCMSVNGITNDINTGDPLTAEEWIAEIIQ